MSLDRTRWCELLVGLHDVEILDVSGGADRLTVTIETTDHTAGCGSCGSRAQIKDRPRLALADLPAFGSPVTLLWVKRCWRCPDRDCPVGSWTEERTDIAPPRSEMTRRAALWATTQVGRHVHTVSWAAAELGVSWHTVMTAIAYWATALIEDPGRIVGVRALGVDETSFLAATPSASTRWVSAICNVETATVVDLIEGRNHAELDRWLAERPREWKETVAATVSDLHEPFRRALGEHFPDATAVADPFHVVAVGNRALDRCRRRIQNETLGHRGHKADPLYRARKLLTIAAERLSPEGEARRHGLLAAGDPDGHVETAWSAKECLRELYTLYGEPAVAGRWLDLLIEDCVGFEIPELSGMARTLRRWRDHILAWHITGISNGPTEGVNSIIKKVKRVGAGFRSFINYRIRVLLAIGGCNWALLGTPPPR